jgi:hypothetical protein
MRVVISAPGDQALNVGKVVADSGKVGVYGALVNQLGLVSANTAVAGENGKIIFKASDTTLLGQGSVTTAQGAGSGGEIQVLGNRVGLTGDAVVDASGQAGGGTVLIGGDTHGDNPSIQNAALTYIGPQAEINANAVSSGDGGKVVVWSEQQTQMYGNISARGGAAGGNGGFVETSSESKLDFQGQVDLRAPAGTEGTLLLDPSDVLISSGPTSGDVTVPSSAPFTITGSNDSSVLAASDLENELGLGNVTVTTSSPATGAPLGGTVTVAVPVAWNNSNSLTLAATQSVNINAPITGASGTLVLSAASGNIVQSSGAAISVASLSASAPNGTVSLTEPTNAISGAIAGVGGQGFSLANSETINVGTVGSTVGITSNNGTVALTAAGDITQSNGPIAAAALSAVATNGSVELSDYTNSVGVVAGSATGLFGFQLDNSTSFSVGSVAGVGGATVTGVNATGAQGTGVFLQTPTAGDITVNATVNAGSSEVLIGAAGAVIQGSGGLVTASSADIYANGVGGIGSSGTPLLLNVGELKSAQAQAGSVYVSNSGDLLVDFVEGAGAVGVSSAGSITTGTPQTCDCALSITGSSVNLTANGLIDVSAAFSVTGTNGVALYAGYNPVSNTYAGSNNTLSVEGSVSGSTVTLSAGGAINVTGTVTGTLTQTPNQYASVPPPPTLQQCIANPSLSGCAAVLPTLSQCEAAPSTLGCSVVLPTLAQCTATPTAAGCSAVLPTLAQCISTPTVAGCSAVLPSLAQCIATPTGTGCSVVLPTLAQCTATPTVTGCSVVLPSLAACIASPEVTGCGAVLPSDSECDAGPELLGCGARAVLTQDQEGGQLPSAFVQAVNSLVTETNTVATNYDSAHGSTSSGNGLTSSGSGLTNDGNTKLYCGD